MKKIFINLCTLFIFITISNAQKLTEFEGVITYTHHVTALSPGYDTGQDYGYMGKSSELYYKAGRYKWLNKDAFMQMDLFRSRDTVEFLQMASTDTILYASNNFINEKLIEYKILRNADTVMGQVCDVLIVTASSNGNEWTRRYAYNNSTPVNADLFKNYKFNSTDFIYSTMKALPLKIELIYKNRKITYTATGIQSKKLPDSFFEFAPGTKFKSLL